MARYLVLVVLLAHVPQVLAKVEPAGAAAATPVFEPPPAATTNKSEEHLAQPLNCDRIGIEDGLPNSMVTAIVQDQDGFLWFGTAEGLARYDGVEMRVYRPKNEPTSISGTYITALSFDAAGRLWVGTADNGISLYDHNTDKFTRYPIGGTGGATGGGTGGANSEGVSGIARDMQGNMWFAHDGGLTRFESAKGTFTAFAAAPLDVPIASIDADKAGNLWLGSMAGALIRWSPNGGQPTTYHPSIENIKLGQVIVSSSGKVWIGSEGEGVFMLDPATSKVTNYRHVANDSSTLSDDTISSIFEDRAHNIWVGTMFGLNRLTSTGKFQRYVHDPSEPRTSLPFTIPVSIYQDREGIMWLGGGDHGLCKFDDERLKFGHYQTRTGVGGVFEDGDGTLWVGTVADGVYKYERSAQRVTRYHTLGGPGLKEPIALDAHWITSLFHDHRGILWIGVKGQGLVAFDPKTETSRLYPPSTADRSDWVWSIAEDNKGILWFATWGGGLVSFDPDRDAFASITTAAGAFLTSDFIYSLYRDPLDANIMWVGTAKGGLIRFNTLTRTATTFRHKDDDPTSLSSDDVMTVYRDPAGIVWVGTYGGGVNRLDPATGKVQRLNTANSDLSSDTVFGIMPDDDGKLWMTTYLGLLRFDPQTSKFHAYVMSDGLQDNEFSQAAYARGKSGELIVGGTGGFNAFFPRDIHREHYVPPVALTSFKVFNQDVTLEHPIWTMPRVEISYSDSFELKFAALSFADPKRNHYAYKLEGFDSDFIETDRPYATYTKLDGGKYQLKVRAANAEGVWNEKAVELSLVVKPPLWKTRKAYGVYIIVLAAAAYLLFYLQRERLRRVHRERRIESMEQGLALSGAVQSGFLPEQSEFDVGDFQLCGFYRPAEACGGDWWWYEAMSNGRHVILVGDVTGHGPGPAMVTASVATAFRVLLGSGLGDLRHVIELLNLEVLRVAKGKYHITMAIVELEEATGRWVLHSAGAPPILTIGAADKHKVHFCPGCPLGTANSFEVGRAEGVLRPGERMFIFTDGIPEIEMPNGNVMGMRHLAQLYERSRSHDLKDARSFIVRYVDEVQAGKPQEDDWTFAMIEWTGPTAQ